MTEEQTPQEKLAMKTDKLKALSLANNIHNLTPPGKSSDESRDVAIVHALKAEQHILKCIMQLKGYMYDPLQQVWVQYRNPVMNQQGIGNFILTIQNLAETIEYSNFKEEEIPKFVPYYYEQNYPYFMVFADEYELAPEDRNLISTLLFNFIITSLFKAKGAGHRNVVRGTYSEDTLSRILPPEQMKQSQGGILGGLAKLNPLKRS